jgi:uncharacterized membrane protein
MHSDRMDEPIFRARLVPHRSLGRTGFLLVMGSVAFAWLATGSFFVANGAWPIIGFCGLDLALLYGAFRLSYRSGRQQEEISISRSCLEIRQIEPSGRATLHRFHPFWTRFDIARNPTTGITSMAVACRGAAVQIGSFLNPDDRESFAKAFARALMTARQS